MPMRKREAKTTREVKEDLSLIVETQYHRLHQELLRLKTSGRIPKGRKIHIQDVENVAVKVGIAKLSAINYLEYEGMVKELRNIEKVLKEQNSKNCKEGT